MIALAQHTNRLFPNRARLTIGYVLVVIFLILFLELGPLLGVIFGGVVNAGGQVCVPLPANASCTNGTASRVSTSYAKSVPFAKTRWPQGNNGNNNMATTCPHPCMGYVPAPWSSVLFATLLAGIITVQMGSILLALYFPMLCRTLGMSALPCLPSTSHHGYGTVASDTPHYYGQVVPQHVQVYGNSAQPETPGYNPGAYYAPQPSFGVAARPQ